MERMKRPASFSVSVVLPRGDRDQDRRSPPLVALSGGQDRKGLPAEVGVVLGDREVAKGVEEDTKVDQDACLDGVVEVDPLGLQECVHRRQLVDAVINGIEQKARAGIPRAIIDLVVMEAKGGAFSHGDSIRSGQCGTRQNEMVLNGV